METMPVVAGNDWLLDELRQMKQKQHLPHALLLHGERGCGKKLIARWYTMLALCENSAHAPCGRCKSCQLMLEDAHPDVMYAEHSGKRGGFSVETARSIRKEAAVLPNNGALRVFLFTDADGMTVQAQNALLKSVEEPLPHACFVFTAETAGVLGTDAPELFALGYSNGTDAVLRQHRKMYRVSERRGNEAGCGIRICSDGRTRTAG